MRKLRVGYVWRNASARGRALAWWLEQLDQTRTALLENHHH